MHYCGLLELWPEEDSGGHLEGHRRAELRSLGRHFSARRRSRSAGRTAASTGRYWMVRSIVYHGWPCSCRSCRTAFFMPDPRRAQPGVEMHCFVHEASRMVLSSAGERKGAVRCQTQHPSHTILQTSEKVSHPVWGSCCFSQPGSGRAPPRPTRPELARPPVQGYNYARNSPNNTKLPPKCEPLLECEPRVASG